MGVRDRDHKMEADEVVPERIWRLTMHYHDLIYIKYYWESIGQQAPQTFLEEMERTNKRLHEYLEVERNQGGAYHEAGLKEKIDEARKSR
jgi:hypothetical protein